MSQSRIPLTVIGGYLGAGKTTLINRLLSDNQGKRLMVLVNDFGAINIDAGLLASSDKETIALTNGCVCCTMGADLFMAIGDVLDRATRPDHIFVEASGIGNPRSIANAAIAEPELEYGGIVTVVDEASATALLHDPLVGTQYREQIACGDIVYLRKPTGWNGAAPQSLMLALRANQNVLNDATGISALLYAGFESNEAKVAPGHIHPDYVQWSYRGERTFDRKEISELLSQRPAGLFRFKGFLRNKDSGGWLVQAVGGALDVSPVPPPEETSVVGIGAKSALTLADCNNWWNTGCA